MPHITTRQNREVASGGLGEVWQATDAVLNRPVAVKLLRADPRPSTATVAMTRAESVRWLPDLSRSATAIGNLSSTTGCTVVSARVCSHGGMARQVLLAWGSLLAGQERAVPVVSVAGSLELAVVRVKMQFRQVVGDLDRDAVSGRHVMKHRWEGRVGSDLH